MFEPSDEVSESSSKRCFRVTTRSVCFRIVSQLEGAGLVERGRNHIRMTRDFANIDELDAFLSEYEQRHTSDRERLEAMMRYGQTVT